MKWKYKAIKTKYWVPGDDYISIIINSTRKLLKNGDIIVISEKALAIAKKNIINEKDIKPTFVALIISRIWMRVFWGYLLAYLCRFRKKTIMRLRSYPIKEGSRHKQVVLNFFGFWQALKYASEGGIDISNLPYSYASLPLTNPKREAQIIRNQIFKETGKKVITIIADTDSTFSFQGIHLSSHRNAIEGIKTCKSPFPFILSRLLKLKQRATPLAVVGSNIGLEDALHLSEIAHHARGHGAGRSVWDVAAKFQVGLSEVSWGMLKQIDHCPIVLIRRKI